MPTSSCDQVRSLGVVLQRRVLTLLRDDGDIEQTGHEHEFSLGDIRVEFGFVVRMVRFLGMVWSKRTTLVHNGFERVDDVGVADWIGDGVFLAIANWRIFLSLAFIQVLKAFAPVITFGVLIAFGLDRSENFRLCASSLCSR